MNEMIGQTIAHYRITASLGAGGMGEVYRAHDPRLNRDVAIKFSKEQFTERFEREARTVAALNHPNICHLYDVGPNYLVMELIEGESPKGPLPLDDALKIARQIADALEAAHEKGIVHRDLKPANIKITPDGMVKVLDFGLAQVNPAPEQGADPEISPTVTIGATVAGTVLGTAAYMAPEQAKGKRVDKRADIWAFGVVLYELLTGDRLFHGEDAVDTLAAVIHKQPALDKAPPETHKLLQRCLEKDPRNRLRDIGDARDLLTEEPAPAPRAAPSMIRLSPAVWAIVGVLAIGLAAASVGWWRAARPVEHTPIRLSVDLGAEAEALSEQTAVLSPDGTRIVFPIRRNGVRQLAMRVLDQTDVTVIPGSEIGRDPFFSPDGQWIGFFQPGRVMKAAVRGGEAIPLCDGTSTFYGGSWGEDGNIIVGSASGLRRCSAEGGALQPEKEDAQTIPQAFPQVLPGGAAVLFTEVTPSKLDANVEALSLKTGKKKALVRNAFAPSYMPAPGGSGYLLYIRQNTMYAVSFDPDKLEIHGSPAPLVEDVSVGNGIVPGLSRQYDVSSTGTLVYLTGKSQSPLYPILSLDASGKTTGLVDQPAVYDSPRFSPDGKHLAYIETGTKGADVWVYDMARKIPDQLTFSAPGNYELAWAPDGKHLVFSSGSTLWWIRADGSAPAEKLLELDGTSLRPQSLSAGGDRLAFVRNTSGLPDIWTLPLDLSDADHPKPGKPEPFLDDPKIVEVDAAFSPDGHWMAYASNESGNENVYVRSFPGPGGKWKISNAGGKFPVWSRTAHELFFIDSYNRIMVADYTAQGNTFSPGVPRAWSSTEVRRNGVRQNFDLSPDGKHVAMFPSPSAETAGPPRIAFILNFFDYVRRLAPPGK